MESDQPLDPQLASELATHLAGGEAIDTGEVTIDQERALAKMHLYGKRKPQGYVLDLVRCACARRASLIEFAVDREDVRIFFDGTPFSAEELEEIHCAALGIHDPAPGLQALATGLGSALALNPVAVRLLSGDAQSRVYLELQAHGLGRVEEVKAGKPGTLIQVRQRYRPGLRSEFTSESAGLAAEVASLRKKCAHASIPIFVNGEQISDPRPPATLAGSVTICDGLTTGFAGFDPARGEDAPFARADFLSGGVHLAGHDLPHFPPWFYARIDHVYLTSDRLSHEVVRDAAYNEVIDQLRRACDQSLQKLAQDLTTELDEDLDATIPEWQFHLLRNSLFLRVSDDPQAQIERDPVFAALAEVELWERGNGELCSTQALFGGPLAYSHRPDDGLVPKEFETVVFIEDDADAQFLTALGAEDVTRGLLRTREYSHNRKRFEMRRHAPRLGDSYYLGRIPLAGENLRGEVGLRGLGSQRCVCRLLLNGCLLLQQALEFPLAGLEVIIEADFQPTSSYIGIHRNEVLASAIFEMLCGVERLVAGVARAWSGHDFARTRALFAPYLHAVADPGFGARRLQEFGFSAGSAARYIRKFGGPAYCPQWDLDSDNPHPLACIPLFAIWGGGACSLAEIATMHRVRGMIPYLPYDFETAATLPDRVLRLTGEDLEVLEALIGADTFIDYEPEIARLGLRATFMERPQRPLELADKFVARVAFEVDGVEGVLGLNLGRLRPERLTATHTRFSILKFRRALGHHTLQMLVPGLVGILNDDDIRENELWNDLAPDLDDAEVGRLDRAIHDGLGALVDEAANLSREQPIGAAIELRRFILLALAAIFEDPLIFACYQKIVQAQGIPAASHALEGLVALFETHSRARVMAALEQAGAGDVFDLGAVRKAAGRKRRLGRKTARTLRERVGARQALLTRVAKLLELPVVRTTGGRALSVHDLVQLHDEENTIHYLGTDAPPAFYNGFERTIVVLGGSESHALSRLLGWDALSCAEDWLRERIARADGQTVELRRPTLPVGERLVAIEVVDAGFEGQLGLRRWGPLRDEPSRITLYKGRSIVGGAQPDHPFTVVGALDHPGLEVDENGHPTPEWETRIGEVLDANQSDLVTRLLDRWEDFNRDERSVACRWVMHLLATRAPGAGGGGAAISRACEDPVVTALISQPVWMTTRGIRVSLAALADAYSEHGAQRYVTGAWVHEPPKMPVVIIEPDQRGWLEALFPTVIDHAACWSREVLTLRRRSQAERLPALPPREALEAVRVDTRGLKGWLWLLPDSDAQACIRLGLDGLEVERRQLSHLFVSEGSVMGASDELKVDPNWGHLRLARSQESALVGCALQLYRELIDTHERALDQGDGAVVRLKGRARRGLHPEVDPVATRRQLAGAVVRLHRENMERDGRLKSSYRRLLRRLCCMDLLELRNHAVISLETALHERPTELAPLGLWRTATVSEPVPSVDTKVTRTVAQVPQLHELPPPTTQHQLLEAVRSELRLVNADPDDLQAETYLDRLSIAEVSTSEKLVVERGGYLVVNLEHPIASAALKTFESDPLMVSALASCIHTDFSSRNQQPGERMLRFVNAHAAHIHSRLPKPKPEPEPEPEASIEAADTEI